MGALALVLMGILPHQHGQASTSHQLPTCRLCRLQEGFAATPVRVAVVHRVAQTVVIVVCRATDRVVASCVLSSPTSRAPPVA